MDADLKEALSLLAPGEQISSAPAARAAPEPTSDSITVLETPKIHESREDYSGPNHAHLVAKKEDLILVCARADKFVLAYNPRNNTTGRIPAAHLIWTGDDTVMESFIFVALKDHEGDLTHGKLSWKVGHHVRVYSWDDEMRKDSGIGLNMATKEIGRFKTMLPHIRILDSF